MKKNAIRILMRLLLLVILVAIIAELYPRYSRGFAYHYEVGKPWGYELIMAEFDFPIYKTDRQLQSERAAILADFAPFYTEDRSVATRQIDDLMAEAAKQELTQEERAFLKSTILSAYETGILPNAEMERLQEAGTKALSIVHERVARTKALSSFLTPRTAYARVFDLAPAAYQPALRALDINLHLEPNLVYDTISSGKMRAKLLDQISLTNGMIQAGEKVIDRGEIVTADTYQVLYSLERAMEEQNTNERGALSIAGEVVLLAVFLLLLGLYLGVFRPQLFDDIHVLLFFTLMIMVVLLLECLLVRWTTLSVYLVPFMWVPVIVRVFFDSRTALYLHMITVMMASFMTSAPFEFLVIQIAVGMLAVSSLRDMAQRSQLAQTAGLVTLAYAIMYTAFTLAVKGTWQSLDGYMYLYFLCNGLLIVFAYGLIYLIERMFGLVSSITLVELTNINSGLLMDFTEKAPASFQHCLQVSNLATEAAKAVGANALLVRTGALYHDIGKMVHPENFTENQQDGHNPLSILSHQAAAQAIISHVTDGIELAKKYHLPQIIIQFIASHHGTSKVRYFYNSYVNAHPGEPVDETLFTYPGEKPTTKEMGILMMADAVEARSRSLSDYSQESISKMVNAMIDTQIADGQLNDTPLSFKDVEDIKEVFIKRLTAINHHRITYPEIQFPKATESKDPEPKKSRHLGLFKRKKQ